MIPIREYRTYWQLMATRVNATQCLFVRTEGELATAIRNIAGDELFLIAVIPSADSNATDVDNILERETCIVYAVKKVDRTNQVEDDVVNVMEETQQVITDIKTLVLTDATDHDHDFHPYLKRMDFSRIHTDPEYNYFGCDGYSLSFVTTSPGF